MFGIFNMFAKTFIEGTQSIFGSKIRKVRHDISLYTPISQYEPSRGKTNNVVSEQVRHKLACTSTEKSWKLEISDLSRRGIVLS